MRRTPYVATCFILDVGLQPRGNSGSSNVILLYRAKRPPDAIVIDCPPKILPTLRLLRDVRRLRHVIITHNDDDHCGGLIKLLDAHAKRGKKVDSVWFLEDRPPPNIRFYPPLKEFREKGYVQRISRLETEGNGKPKLIFPSRKPSTEEIPTLEVLYPQFEDNLDAQGRGDRNAASGILRFTFRGRAVLFPGDAQVESLRRARDSFASGHPIRCDVLVVPHHGGALRNPKPRFAELSDLYSNVVNCDHAVVQVATRNRHGHPFSEHVSALTSNKSGVLCCQITEQCCQDLNALGGVMPSDPFVPQAGRPGGTDGVACAGSVAVDIGGQRLKPRRGEIHRAAVDRIGGNPLCRPKPGTSDSSA